MLPDPEAAKAPLLARAAAGRVPGLGDVLAGTATLAEAMRPFPGVRRLSVIVAGDNADLLEDLPSDKGTRLLSELQAQAPFVVIATSAADEAAMLGMAELAGTVVLVTEIGRNRRAEVAAWLRGFSQMRARVLGAVTLPAAGRRDGKRTRDAAQAPRAESGDSHAGLPARDASPRERLPREPDKRTATPAARPRPRPAQGHEQAPDLGARGYLVLASAVPGRARRSPGPFAAWRQPEPDPFAAPRQPSPARTQPPPPQRGPFSPPPARARPVPSPRAPPPRRAGLRRRPGRCRGC